MQLPNLKNKQTNKLTNEDVKRPYIKIDITNSNGPGDSLPVTLSSEECSLVMSLRAQIVLFRDQARLSGLGAEADLPLFYILFPFQIFARSETAGS